MRQEQRPAVRPTPTSSTPGTARYRRNSRSDPACSGARYASRSAIVPGATVGHRRAGLPRTPARAAGGRHRAARTVPSRTPANRVVELAHAAETGRERDLRQTQSGRFDQSARRLRPLRPGQRQRTGAEFGGQHPVQVALGVAEPAGEAGHAVPVDDPVADQPHRPADHVGPDVPLR